MFYSVCLTCVFLLSSCFLFAVAAASLVADPARRCSARAFARECAVVFRAAYARPARISAAGASTILSGLSVDASTHHTDATWQTWLAAVRQVSASESERAYSVLLALPGLDARSLRINQSGRRLTVSGSRSRAAAGQGAARFAFAWDLPVRACAA